MLTTISIKGGNVFDHRDQNEDDMKEQLKILGDIQYGGLGIGVRRRWSRGIGNVKVENGKFHAPYSIQSNGGQLQSENL